MYQYIKWLHMACAALTALSFILRGIWMINESPVFLQRWTKILPHVIDTLLLLSALLLLWLAGWNPAVNSWLLAKIIALLLYIGLGMLAFRFVKRKPWRIVCWLLALLVLMQIYVLARGKTLDCLFFLCIL